MRRIGTIFLVLLLIISCFSGCKPKKTVNTQNSTGVANGTTAVAYDLPIGHGETIVYSGPDSWYAPASLSEDLPVWQEVEKRLNIKIKWEVSSSDQWNTTMFTRIASGRDLPDIMGLPTWQNANIDRLASEGVIIPLTDLINKYAPNIQKILNQNSDARKQMTAPNGNIYSIDECFEANEYYDSLLIRKDWLDKLNLSVPKTIQEFTNVFKAFKENDLNGNGKNDEIPLSVSEGYKYTYLSSGFGLASPLQDCLPDANGKVIYEKSTSNYKDYLAYLNYLYENGLMDPQYAVGDAAKFEALVSQNIIGVTVGGGDWEARYEADLHSAGYTDADYMLIDPPADENGKVQLVKRQMLGGQIGISTDCKNPELCIKIMDYLWGSDEGNTLLHYGLEGQSYTTDANGKKEFTDFVKNNSEGLDAGSALRSIGAWPPLFDRQTREFMSDLFPADAVKYYADNMAAGKYVNPFPKMLYTQEEVSSSDEILGDLETYQQEMELKFILGQEDISKYDTEYLPKMKELRLDDYVVIRQGEYDRYMGTN